jgi:RNA polymerase sigma factor (sigma-70 family)
MSMKGWFGNINRVSGEELSDEQLLLSYFNSGKLTYLQQLLEKYLHIIFAFSYQVLQDRDQARTASLSVLHIVQREIKDAPPTAFSEWMYRICREVCILAIRKQIKSAELTLEYLLAIEQTTPVHFNGTANWFVTKDPAAQKSIENILHQMNSDEKDILLLFYKEQKSYEEISKILELSPGKIKTKLHNGRKTFIKKIQLSNLK